MKHYISLLLFLLLISSTSLAKQENQENFEYLMNSQSLKGPTGNIITPSPFTAKKDKLSIGLHKFNIGLNYGILPSCEAGIQLDLKESLKNLTSTNTVIYSKYHIFKQQAYADPLDFSVGTYGNSLFFLVSRQLNEFFDTMIECGADFYWSKQDKIGYFIAISKPTKYSCFMFDYKSYNKQANLGWRVLLSPDIKLDLFIVNLEDITSAFNNFVFGLTLAN